VNQEILPEYFKHNVTNFLELHSTIYAAAVATVRMSGASIDRKKLNHIQNKKQAPPWERRLEEQIVDLGKDIGLVQQAQNGDTSNILQRTHPQDKEKSIRTGQTRSKQCSHHGNA
jgi:phage terminase small subunit